jgi:hypothetical protein
MLYKENYSENVFHRDNLQKVHTKVEFLPQTIHLKDIFNPTLFISKQNLQAHKAKNIAPTSIQ